MALIVGASEIAAGNTDLSPRTGEQADEMTTNVKRSAANAEHAARLASDAADVGIML